MSAAAGLLPLYRRRVAITVKTPVALISQALMPVLWVLVVGPALASAVGRSAGHLDYFTYVAIGQIVFVLPFSAMFAGLTVLNDRNFGILRELLVAPIRRATIPLASIAAVLTVASGQIALIVVLSVLRGAHFHFAVGPTLAASPPARCDCAPRSTRSPPSSTAFDSSRGSCLGRTRSHSCATASSARAHPTSTRSGTCTRRRRWCSSASPRWRRSPQR